MLHFKSPVRQVKRELHMSIYIYWFTWPMQSNDSYVNFRMLWSLMRKLDNGDYSFSWERVLYKRLGITFDYTEKQTLCKPKGIVSILAFWKLVRFFYQRHVVVVKYHCCWMYLHSVIVWGEHVCIDLLIFLQPFMCSAGIPGVCFSERPGKPPTVQCGVC